MPRHVPHDGYDPLPRDGRKAHRTCPYETDARLCPDMLGGAGIHGSRFRPSQTYLPRMRRDLPGLRCKLRRARRYGGMCSDMRSEEHTSELQSLMRISYAVFCLKKKK